MVKMEIKRCGGRAWLNSNKINGQRGSHVAVGVTFIAASWAQPGVVQTTHRPSSGPAAPALLRTGSALSARAPQGFGIPHTLSGRV